MLNNAYKQNMHRKPEKIICQKQFISNTVKVKRKDEKPCKKLSCSHWEGKEKHTQKQLFNSKKQLENREGKERPSPQPSLTLLKGVWERKNSSKVVERSTSDSSNLFPLTAKTKLFCFPVSTTSSIICQTWWNYINCNWTPLPTLCI